MKEELRRIKKLFQDTRVKIACPTQNTIRNTLRPQAQRDKYSRSGVHQKKRLDCPLKCIGKTERTFNVRYKEHIHDIRSNNRNSVYSSHIPNTGTYGPICDTMDVITTGRKGKYLNTLGRYHVYRISKDNLHMNDTYNDIHYPIFEILHELHTR